jgi:hypothetical protein
MHAARIYLCPTINKSNLKLNPKIKKLFKFEGVISTNQVICRLLGPEQQSAIIVHNPNHYTNPFCLILRVSRNLTVAGKVSPRGGQLVKMFFSPVLALGAGS